MVRRGHAGLRPLSALVVGLILAGCGSRKEEAVRLRVATFNIEDLRTEELKQPEAPRPRAAAALLQRLRPDVLLVNEIAYDQPGAPGWETGDEEGGNGRRFAELFLAVAQDQDLEPLPLRAFMAPVNTGVASGFDLDKSGGSGVAAADPETLSLDEFPPSASASGRAYGADAWGYGTFPGQYGLALLVRPDLEILVDRVRTFRSFPWSRMPGALRPRDPATGAGWYGPAEWAALPLSSKSHWDVPLRLPDGTVLHILASHPTPPAFDGPEERNRKRNHDEIRFWGDYLDGADYIVDDAGRPGGLEAGASFVILGDLNADPDEGRSLNDPVGRWLLAHPRVGGGSAPVAEGETLVSYPQLDPDDTSGFGLRVDYVLPSAKLRVLAGGVLRPPAPGSLVSDHFPVWLDLEVP